MMRKYYFTTLALYFYFLSCSTGQVLDNTSESVSSSWVAGAAGAFNDMRIAQEFMTGGSAINNQTITVTLNMNNVVGTPSNFQVKIYNKNGSSPDTEIASLSGNNNPTTAGNYSYTSNITLGASTSYFIVALADYGSPTNYYSWNSTGSSSITTSNGFSAPYDLHFSSNGGTLFTQMNANERMIFSISFGGLPVELTYFKGKSINNFSHLQWQTATEKNNEGFNIERSIDGRNWETIGFVQGHGTTQEVQNYTYTDEVPLAGTNYYRLKQMDFDGAFEYSSIVNVNYELGSKNYELEVFPNPVQDELNIVNGEGIATIYNVLGQPVKELIINNSQLTIDVKDLPKGQYILRISQQNGNVVTRQFLK